MFDDGVSTRDTAAGRSRGIGLGLARRTARARGGDVTFVDAGTGGPDGCGAVAVARLPGVLGAEAVR